MKWSMAQEVVMIIVRGRAKSPIVAPLVPFYSHLLYEAEYGARGGDNDGEGEG